MSITGNRVNIAADLLEFLILISQVFQLCRANKGKICGIEEKYAPPSQDVFLCHLLKFTLYIGLYFKITYFFTN